MSQMINSPFVVVESQKRGYSFYLTEWNKFGWIYVESYKIKWELVGMKSNPDNDL